MNLDNSQTNPGLEEDLDDPYIHSVSTEEFVETVSKEENDEVLTPIED